MKIGELAERTGLTASRIRFYERIGLLKLVERQPNGYRSYPPEAVLALNLITSGQQAGFSLEELRTLLPPSLTKWEHGKLLETLRHKVQDIEALQAKLALSRSHLVALIAEIESKPRDMDCTTNAKRVLSRMGLDEKQRPPQAADKAAAAAKRVASRRPVRG